MHPGPVPRPRNRRAREPRPAQARPLRSSYACSCLLAQCVTPPGRPQATPAALYLPATLTTPSPPRIRRNPLFQGLLDLLGLEELEDVALLDVGVALEHDAAL